MKVKIDQDTCIGCEACEGFCPEVFEMREDGKAYVIKEDIDSKHDECATESIDVCPVGAISKS